MVPEMGEVKERKVLSKRRGTVSSEVEVNLRGLWFFGDGYREVVVILSFLFFSDGTVQFIWINLSFWVCIVENNMELRKTGLSAHFVAHSASTYMSD
jgi:hypothetical protein